MITSRGKAKAALVSTEDLYRLEEAELEVESQMLTRAMHETTEFRPLEGSMAELLEEPDGP